MNTKTDGISSGLVAVAHMMQSPDGQCMGFLPFAEEGTAPVVRLSDAEAIISDLQNLVIAENQRKQQLEQEVERLRHFETAFTEWLEKSDWVQEDKDGLFYGWALGLHRADAMRKLIAKQAERIKELETEFAGCSELLDNAERIMEQQAATLKLAKDAFSAIDTEAKTFRSYENARNNFSNSIDEWKAYERAAIKASDLTKKALAAIDSLQKGE